MKGATIDKKYKIIQVLGQDSLTETFLAQGRGLYYFKRYVIKRFRPILGNPQAREIKHLFYQEAKILKLLSGKNPQIPRLYDYFMDGEDFYLVREWIEGVTLEQKVKKDGKLPEQEVVQILGSILSVLQYIHNFSLVYRELSPSSIVLRQQNWLDRTSKKACLPIPIYFSGIEELEKESHKLNRRTLILANQAEYFAPEQKQGELVCANDFYSLGLTAIYLLTGKNPAEFEVSLYTNRLVWQQEVPNLTVNLTRVIDRAISPNQKDRFVSAKEMSDALFPQSVLISESLVTQPEAKPRFTPEIKIVTGLSLLSLGTVSLFFALLNFDFDSAKVGETRADRTSSELNKIDSIKESSSKKKIDPVATGSVKSVEGVPPSAVLNLPVFRVGTPQEQFISSLGEPNQEGQGYWGNSRAFLYEDFAQKDVDLGYLSDAATQTILQTEMSFPESIEAVEIQQVLRQLLMADYSVEIEQQIEQVVGRKSDKQEFSVNNLEGIIQRNLQNRVYVAVWQAGFHQ